MSKIEALTPEQKNYYDEQVTKIRRGGSQHGAWAQDHIFGMGSYNLGPIEPPVVAFGQDDDPFYTQYLQNWDEVNALINDLRTEAEKAWGKEKNHILDAKNMVAQPKQEPVACTSLCVECTKRGDWVCAKAIPSQRTWVGLTDEEVINMEAFYAPYFYDFYVAIEAKLKEKNT